MTKFCPPAYIRSLTLFVCGAVLIWAFRDIGNLSEAFEQGSIGNNRPIIPVLQSFWIAFAAYFVAWATIGGFSRGRDSIDSKFSWCNLIIIFVFGIAFRWIMVPSIPIQEIDIYRYVWDGAVVANQLDPYRFGPKTVLDAVDNPELNSSRPGLEEYTQIAANRPGLRRVLEIIHFGKYTSPYPPTSQLFFATAVSAVPKTGKTKDYVVVMKIMLTIFDVLTGVIVAFLLFHVGKNPEWSLAYLWCPLIIKEIANSGHLDSIATFFMILAVYFAARAAWNRLDLESGKQLGIESPEYFIPTRSIFYSIISSLSLAAAFAAKVYPIVLVPLWFVVLFRRTGILAVFSIGLFAGAALLFSYPMLQHLELAKKINLVNEDLESNGKNADDLQSDPNGIEAFSKYWEMNDFLFMLTVENLKPDEIENSLPAEIEPIDYEKTPWFRFTSNPFRSQIIEKAEPYLVSDNSNTIYQPKHIAFFLTRTITILIFGLIVAWTCLVLVYKPEPRRWLELAFLTLAWFWLLSPTQNPWYWTWAIPLLAFARSRIWFFMSGVLFVYYLRFWIEYHFEGIDVASFMRSRFEDPAILDLIFPCSDLFQYKGTTFFDFYVPILEFGPLLVLLLIGWAGSIATRQQKKC